MNAITGERLQDLFVSEPWHDLLTTLSDSLGFSLSVYAQTGRLIFAPLTEHSQCGSFLATSPGSNLSAKYTAIPHHERSRNGKLTSINARKDHMLCTPVEYLGKKR